MLRRIGIALLLLVGAVTLSGCYATIRVDGPVIYHPTPAPVVVYEPYYVIVHEQVRYGCCTRYVERRVQVFWHQGYQSWGYWAIDGTFIYY